MVVVETFNNGVGDDGQVAGFLRRRQRGAQRRKIRAVPAAAFANAAQLTRPAAERDVLRGGFREVRATSDRHAARGMVFFGPLLERDFQAVERHRRQKQAIGQMLEAFVRAGDSREFFDAVIPRRDIGVANRPVDAVAVLLVGVEIHVAHPVGLSTPVERAATQVIAANPGVRTIRGSGVRMLAVAHPPLFGRRVEGVALTLDRVVLGDFVLRHLSAVRHFPGRREIQVVGAVLDVTSALDDERLQTPLAQFLGDPAAADPGTDNDGVEVHGS